MFKYLPRHCGRISTPELAFKSLPCVSKSFKGNMSTETDVTHWLSK